MPKLMSFTRNNDLRTVANQPTPCEWKVWQAGEGPQLVLHAKLYGDKTTSIQLNESGASQLLDILLSVFPSLREQAISGPSLEEREEADAFYSGRVSTSFEDTAEENGFMYDEKSGHYMKNGKAYDRDGSQV